MNNDNNQNKITDLAALYGTSSNDNPLAPAESMNNQQIQVEKNIPSSENNFSQPTNDNLNPNPVQEPMDPNNQLSPPSGNKGNNNIITFIAIIVIVAIACYWLFFDKPVKESPNNQNNPQQEYQNTPSEIKQDEDNTERDNKEKMINTIKNMSHKIDSYVKNNEYECNDDALIKPTRFIVEIDTSDGNSIAQQNAKLVINDSKSSFNNRDTKGYFIVERQIHGGTIFVVNLSDGVYGTSGEVNLKEIKEDNISANVAYPASTNEGIKCQLGSTTEDEDW